MKFLDNYLTFKILNYLTKKENWKAKQKGKVDRHSNLEITKKTEHDNYTYKTKQKTQNYEQCQPRKTGVNSGGTEW